MRNNLIPFYTYSEKDRLGFSLFIDMQTMNVYRQYSDYPRFSQRGKYWITFYILLWTTKELVRFNFSLHHNFAILAFIIVSIISFFLGFVYFYNKELKQADLKDVFLTKNEFVFYVEKGRKTCMLLAVITSISILILVISAMYFFMTNSFFALILCAFLFFLIGVLLRAIPLRRIRLHISDDYAQSVAKRVIE